jgi:flagellar basal-body rod modification protein FlgD
MYTQSVQQNLFAQDYLKLMMQELTYQDPLNPMDNKDFLSQMAQFSALEAAKVTQENIQWLTHLETRNQSLLLLGKHVQTEDGTEGVVYKTQFSLNQEPLLSISMQGSPREFSLSQVTAVW